MRAWETKILEEACVVIRDRNTLSASIKQRLGEIFGQRFENALKALNEVAVKKYVFTPSGRIVWIMVGRERDYQILPEVYYCSCDDFYYHVLDGKISLCYHMIAQRLAEALGKYEAFTESDAVLENLMAEWRFIKQEDIEEKVI